MNLATVNIVIIKIKIKNKNKKTIFVLYCIWARIRENGKWTWGKEALIVCLVEDKSDTKENGGWKSGGKKKRKKWLFGRREKAREEKNLMVVW